VVARNTAIGFPNVPIPTAIRTNTNCRFNLLKFYVSREGNIICANRRGAHDRENAVAIAESLVPSARAYWATRSF
jgi:hypothetical protein